MVRARRRAADRSSAWPGAWVGVSICEDVWFDDGPVAQAGRAGADVVVNLNASPYNRGRRAERLAMLSRPGGRGRLRHRLREPGGRPGRARLRRRLARRGGRRDAGRPRARSSPRTWSSSTCPIGPHRPHAVTELLPRVAVTEPRRAERPALAPAPPRPPLSDHAEVYAALVLGTRDYLAQERLHRGGHRPVGRHRLVARGHRRRRRARARARVHGIAMPSRYSSEGSRRRRRARWPSDWASTSRWCRSRRPTSPSPPCWRPCSGASPSA